jgi:hypothetical protein
MVEYVEVKEHIARNEMYQHLQIKQSVPAALL